MKTVFGVLVATVLVAAGVFYYATHSGAESLGTLRTTPIKRGDIQATITATGTVEPEEVVDVGAQVVGRIKDLGVDPSDPQKKKRIDYGSIVREGTELAYIDDAVYQAQVDQATANLLRSQADLIQAQAKRDQCEQEFRRAEFLKPTKAIAATDYDLAVANFKASKALVGVNEAVIKQNEALLRLAKTNFAYTIIKSPVEGIIIDRRVNIGQTVVASLNAPSLFLIAKDLARMEVWASVNEADIGRITVGLPVHFSVDARPKETFRGTVKQIRLNATTTQNVVTYTVVIETDNSDRRLLPYLTANVQFEIDQRTGVLMVPNAALRWKPRSSQIAPAFRDAVDAKRERKNRSGDAAGGGRAAADGKTPAKADATPDAKQRAKNREERGRLWVKEGDYVRPIDVRIGSTDGTNTEVSAEELKEDIEVVLGEIVADPSAGDTTNPFAPKLFRGGKMR